MLIKIKEKHIREYYLEETIKGSWSVIQLERQINTFAYSRSLRNIALIENTNDTTDLKTSNLIKDPYILEFLGLDNNLKYIEKELEEALINNYKISY